MKQTQLDTGIEPADDGPDSDSALDDRCIDFGGADVATIALVGCGKSKADSARPAKDLYRSGYFSLKRDLADHADQWYILSAEHGLLHPETVIEPYDTEWGELSAAAQHERVEYICNSLKPELTPATRVIFLAGKTYRQPVIAELTRRGIDADLVEPFTQTTGYQDQMQFLSAECDRLNNA